MKKRKKIAVVISNVMYFEYQHRILEGLLMQAAALDYDVAVFTLFMNSDMNTEYQQGENEIFNLIHFEMFDALIYVPYSFVTNSIRCYVEDLLYSRCTIPVVVMETEMKDFSAVMVDDDIAFEQIVDHLIDVHGVTDILCLTGFQNNSPAEQRLLGYRRSMEKHGLAVPEDRVIYGDFWTMRAEELAKEIADGTIRRPQAVVCACDKAAISLCNRLIEFGIRVPEDILITGYDATDEAADNVPSITSYTRPLRRMGSESVLRVHLLLTGEEAATVIQDYGKLTLAQSCGCGEDFMQKFYEHQKDVKGTVEYRRLFENCPMAESLNTCTNLNALLAQISGYLYLVNGFEEFYLCLCNGWDDFAMNNDESGSYRHYTPKMRETIRYNKRTDPHAYLIDQLFPVEQLLPQFWEDRDIPSAFYITPLHFNERCFGYTALGYGNKPLAFDAQYHAWIRNLNNALEFLRVRNFFNSVTQRMFVASIRDTLTGIYNRKGFQHYAPELFKKAQTTGKKLLVLAADLDLLKKINDGYGHLEGDNAITKAANALNSCLEYGEICARTGGDEFLMIGCASYTEEKIQQYINRIQRTLDRYNADSDKPYAVGVSIGYVCREVTETDTLQEILDEADVRMYENKIARKKQRTE